MWTTRSGRLAALLVTSALLAATVGGCQKTDAGPETACTDGADNDGDGRVDCADPDCANAAACQPEVCDNLIDDDGDGDLDCADAECVGDPACPQTTCGDGVLELPEQCDDSNTTPGDGCSDACRLEPLSNVTSATPIGGVDPSGAVYAVFGEFTTTATGEREAVVYLSDDPMICHRVAASGLQTFSDERSVGNEGGTIVAITYRDTQNTALASGTSYTGNGTTRHVDGGFSVAVGGSLAVLTGYEIDALGTIAATTVSPTTFIGAYDGVQTYDFETSTSINVPLRGSFTATVCPAIAQGW